MHLGDTGPDVAALQNKLGISAEFGLRTDQAVRAYQQAHGLQVDGLVGEETRKALGL